MLRFISALVLLSVGLLAACGGGADAPTGPSAEDLQATQAYLDSLPELEVTVSGGVEMAINTRNASLVCTGPTGIVPNTFALSADNLTIYIPVNAEPGELPVVGRNEPTAVTPGNVVFEYLPTGNLFFANGGEGTFTLTSLPARVGEFAMGSFSVQLSNTDDTTIQLDGTFRTRANLGTFSACRDQLVETPVPTSTPIPSDE